MHLKFETVQQFPGHISKGSLNDIVKECFAQTFYQYRLERTEYARCSDGNQSVATPPLAGVMNTCTEAGVLGEPM